MSTQDLNVGDIVNLIPTATYYDGRIIPSWVKNDQWIVAKVNGDRIVIDRNVSGSHSICSPVHMKNVEKVM